MVKTELIKEKMKKQKIRATDMAKALGIDKSTWYRKIKEPKKITIGDAEKICEILALNAKEVNTIFSSQYNFFS